MRSVALAVLLGMAVMPAASQTPAQKPGFEVASIKPGRADYAGGSCHGIDSKINPLMRTAPPPLGTCVFNGATLRDLVRVAYRFELQEGMADLVTGGPAWVRTERFDVQAKAVSPEKTTVKELNVMFQELLADRFKLRLHRDSKEVQGYSLVVAKNGPKLTPSTEPDSPGSLLPTGPFQWNGKNVPLSGLASSLSGLFQAPVIDKTELTGRYTFTLKYAPIRPPGVSPGPLAQVVPSIFEALPDQLGLRLEREKASVEILVIDSVQRPSEN